VERQPGVEHLLCKARKPLVPPTISIWRPEITFLQIVQYCGALLAAQTHRAVRSNPTYQVRVVFGCNHISHFERNANNSASSPDSNP
jgi:hypothetical protein